MKINRYIKYCFFLILTGTVMASCEKMNETYSEFVKGGEILYSGKADSLKAFSGKNRVKLTWLLISDPKIIKTVVYWNNRADSLVIPVQRSSGVDHIEVIVPNLEEGVYTFDVFNYDAAGNSSIKSEVIGEVYGDTFQGVIHNRPLQEARWDNNPGKNVIVKWFGIAAQAVAVDLFYTDVSNSEKKLHLVKLPKKNDPNGTMVWPETDTLKNYKAGTSFKYRTSYLPSAGAIDTFYTDYAVISDIKNFIPPPPPPPADENFALNKSVTVSSSSGSSLTDGDRSGANKWQPSSSDRPDLNVWFYVNLSQSTEINTTQIYFTKDPGKITYYEVLTTDESSVTANTVWKRAFINLGSPDAEDIHRFSNVTAKYVKVNIGIKDSGTNMNVSEIEVYKFK